MKKGLILFLFVFLIVANVYAEDINDYGSLTINTEMSSSLLLERVSPSTNVDYVYANLTFFPTDNEFQKVTRTIITNPIINEKIGDDYIYLKWDNPKIDKLDFKINSVETVETNFRYITSKVKFPIETNLDEFESYLISTETVTSDDPLIIAKANELAQGEDDLFVVVHKIGEWVKNNIEYDLGTLTAEVSQNSSWVLENKVGVCDELTSLFVAMLRSVKIPARFVTGQSYTNLIGGFGNHAWAEVYFPGYGWIAFDPTYGQLGYVDASHIKMKIGQDVKDSDINYGWLSNKVNVESSGLKIESKVLSKGNLYQEDVELTLEVLKNDLGSKSYLPVKVNVKNLNNYYLPVNVYINKAPVKVDDYTREILLKPNEEKSVFFILKTPQSLEKGFVYTSEVNIVDNFNHNANEILHFFSDGPKFSLEDAQNLIDQFEKEEEKTYSKNVDLICDLDKNYYYEYESGKITCTLTNKGNTNLNDVKLCYNDGCKIINLNLVEEKTFEFEFSPNDKSFLITASSNDVNKVFLLNPNILKTPNLTLNILDYPGEINYFDNSLITFNLNVNTEIKNVEIILNDKEISTLESFSNEKDLNINLKGYDLKDVNILMIKYEDKNGNLYSTEKTFNVKVDKPLYAKLWWLALIIIIIVVYYFSKTSQSKKFQEPRFRS